MRPSLSPLEYGAYGTPSTKDSVEVGGPHVSSDGRDVIALRESVKAIGILFISWLLSRSWSCGVGIYKIILCRESFAEVD